MGKALIAIRRLRPYQDAVLFHLNIVELNDLLAIVFTLPMHLLCYPASLLVSRYERWRKQCVLLGTESVSAGYSDRFASPPAVATRRLPVLEGCVTYGQLTHRKGPPPARRHGSRETPRGYRKRKGEVSSAHLLPAVAEHIHASEEPAHTPQGKSRRNLLVPSIRYSSEEFSLSLVLSKEVPDTHGLRNEFYLNSNLA